MNAPTVFVPGQQAEASAVTEGSVRESSVIESADTESSAATSTSAWARESSADEQDDSLDEGEGTETALILNAETAERCQRRELNKLRKRLRRQVGHAIADYGMIREGDKVMVCLSGGKDSYTMLDILMSLQRSAPVHFDLIAVNLDQKQPGFPEHVLPAYLDSIGVPYQIIEKDTYTVVQALTPEGKTMCAVCSRMRRGSLYGFAKEIGATRIALGHHRDDILQTLFLNMFYGGKLKAMAPKLVSDDGAHVVIRPMAYVAESDIVRYAEWKKFPIIPCNLCGSQENLQRKIIGDMLRDWEKKHPGRLDIMFRALTNVAPSHLADRGLFDFASLEADPAVAHCNDNNINDNMIDVLDLS